MICRMAPAQYLYRDRPLRALNAMYAKCGAPAALLSQESPQTDLVVRGRAARARLPHPEPRLNLKLAPLILCD